MKRAANLVYEWFIDLGTHRNIITDGSTRKLENLIVTTVPYPCSKEEKSIWLARGSTIHRQAGMPWVVLHHVPAKNGLGVSGEESEASELLAAYRPDYFVWGHDHEISLHFWPKLEEKLGERTCSCRVNCWSAPIPNYIKLEPNRENSLGTRPVRRGYPRMVIYDHLVLKLDKDWTPASSSLSGTSLILSDA